MSAPITALTLWRHECRRGLRTPATIDGLFRAACFEIDAARYEADAVALGARAEAAESTSDAARWTALALVAWRDADEYRRRAADALTADAPERAA